jgi:DNA-binding NarL/FixJ family response regulator
MRAPLPVRWVISGSTIREAADQCRQGWPSIVRDRRRLGGGTSQNLGGRRGPQQYLDGMSPRRANAAYDRVLERRPAVALARHYREAEGLSIAQIAERLGRAPATVMAYF